MRFLRFALLAVLAAGCNKSDQPRVPMVEVTGFSPAVLDLATPQPFEVTGRDFEPVDGQATVVFTAESGTPFVGGTLASVEVTAKIVSETRIEGTIALPGVTDPVAVGVTVRLADGSVSGALTGASTLMDSSLEPPRVLDGPALFLDLDDDGVAGPGDRVIVAFDREVVVNGAVPEDFPLHPAGAYTYGAGASVVAGPAPNEVSVVLGAGAVLKCRHRHDEAAAGPNAATGLDVAPATGHVTNVAGKDPEPSARKDLFAGFAPGGAFGTRDTRDVVVADLDRDGWHDVLAADYLGNHAWYRNDGTGRFTALDLPVDNDIDDRISDFTTAAAVGDLNRDGFPDIVLARADGGNWVLLFDVTRGRWVFLTDLGQADTRDVALGDIDGDGDLDVVSANAGGGSRVWRNNLDRDPAGFEESGVRLEPGLVSEAVAVADFDRDGDLDIALGNVGAPNTVWLNTTAPGGDIAFADSGALMGTARTFDLAAGDVDGDGDLDLVAANNQGLSRVWKNDPAALGTAGWFGGGDPLGAAAGDTRAVALGDLDADGDADLVVGTAFSATNVWLNDGTGAFTATNERLGAGRVRGLALADLDHDGDMDLVTGNAGAADGIWKGSLAGTWGTATLTPAGTPAALPFIESLDVRGTPADGWIAAGDAAGRNALWRIDAGVISFERALGAGAVVSIAAGTLDAGPDAAVCTPAGLEVRWSDGTTTVLAAGATYRHVEIADANGDAFEDVVATRDGGVELWLNDQAGGLALASTLAVAGESHMAATAADMDGDGDVDVVAGHTAGAALWLFPFAAAPDVELAAPPVHAVRAFGVARELYVHAAADGATGVVAVASGNLFRRAAGWDEIPADGETITVSGFADNDGTYTVVSAGPTEIVVSGGDLEDEDPSANDVTIHWTVESEAPKLDIVAATAGDVRVWFNQQAGRGDAPAYSAPAIRASAGTTGVAAGLRGGESRVTASRADGIRYWTGAGLATTDLPGPPAGDAGAGDADLGESVTAVAQGGLGHATFGYGTFAYAKETVMLRDLDRDGGLDLVVPDDAGTILVRMNEGGAFGAGAAAGAGFAACGDVDGNGTLDLVTADADRRGLRVWSNDGAGSFTAGAELLPGEPVRGALVIDLNHDGAPDIVALAESGVAVLAGPAFDPLPVALPPATAVAAADLDRNGRLDLLLGGGTAWRQQADGSFVAGAEDFGGVRAFAVGDVNLDGRTDVVSGGRDEPLTLWLNPPVGSLAPVPLAAGPWIEALRLADLDGDGDLDLFAGVFGGANRVYRNAAGFVVPEELDGTWTEAIALGDVDRDGDLDYASRDRERPAEVKRNE